MNSQPVRVTSRGEAQLKEGLGSSRLIALIAFLLPAIVFAAAVLATAAWESGREALQQAKADAKLVIDRVDDELQRDIRALSAVARRISGVPIMQARPAPGAAEYNAELFPHWLGSVVWTLDGRKTLFSSIPGDTLPEPMPAWGELMRSSAKPVVDGVGAIAGQPAIFIHVPVPGDTRGLVVTTAVRPQHFLNILMRNAPEDGVSAIVDRHGNFIARSLDHENRVGTSGTDYVRAAIRKGGAGDYRGRTWEGLENFTAYDTSPFSGWSAHIAISENAVEASLPWATWTALVGIVISTLLAGSLVWLIHVDSRRRHRAERTLANARRVETIGRLTGGIAHDFNNLLTVIIGSLERTKKRMPEAAQSKDVNMALEGARRAADLTRSLLLYSRQNGPSDEVLDLNACMREAADVMRRTVGAGYDIVLDLDDSAGWVRGDNAQMASALLNLVVNARDAMPSGGAITLRTLRRVLARDDAETGLPAGTYAVVSVSDNGPGMPADVARRAFDPFFTTKDVAKGTGLGLAQVDAFARQHGGVAQLETSAGAGTTVSLVFPAANGAVAGAAAEATAIPEGLRVLLVEDEPGVLEHAATLLEELGCKVVACADVDCAFAALGREPFDLLMSDIVLPGGRSGVAIAEHVEQAHPDIAILLATGYAREELAGREGRWPVLLKPYETGDLAAAIADALTRKSAANQRF